MKVALARLNRRLKRKGEWVYLRRRSASGSNTSFVECRIPAFVKALTLEELVGGITQQNFIITVSPTHIREQQWPGGDTAKGYNALIPPSDSWMPAKLDLVFVRNKQRSIDKIAPIYEGDQCIRIDLSATG